MSLRDMFYTLLREKLYTYLKQGILREWATELIYKIVDGAIQEKMYDVNMYLQNHIVTLRNMDPSATVVVKTILLPYITKKRVE